MTDIQKLRASITPKDNFADIPKRLDRLFPQIITEMDNEDRIILFQDIEKDLEPYITLESIESPKQLYDYFFQNRNETIIIKADILTKRKNYLNILEGAVGSNPDSCDLWPIYYPNHKSFTFIGRLIILTKMKKDELRANPKYKSILRDSILV